MPILACGLAAFVIGALFYVWRDGIVMRLKRERILRERVAYMLWVAAQQC